MRVFVLLALTASALRLNTEEQAAANPIRRIVNLLQKLQAEVEAEGKKEEKLYYKFHCYCKNGAGKLTKELSDGQAQMDQLKADVESKTGRKGQLDVDVKGHQADRSEAKDAIKTATGIREKENAEYTKLTSDLQQNVAALNKAIAVLSRGMGKSFLQAPANVAALRAAVDASHSDSMAKEQVVAFITQKSPYGDYQASSGEIVGILKEMKDEMDRDNGGAISKEEEAVKSFNELVAAKEAEIAAATAGIEKKTVRSGELAVEIAEDKNSLENALKEFDANQQFLLNMDKDCKTKKAEYDERVKQRTQEQLAISEAIKVLNDDDALDIFKKTLPSPKSFIQLGMTSAQMASTAAAWVASAAGMEQGRSTQLSLISYMLRTGKIDFSKVLKMIDEMVAHLGQEQKDDDDQLEYCNSNLNRAGDEKRTLERDIKDLTAEMGELEARMEQLKAQIASLTARIAENEKAMADATAQRKDENAAFQQSQTELTAATQLINKAKNRLYKFYNPKLYKAPAPRELTEDERIAQNMGEVLPTEAPQYIAGTKITVLQEKPAPAPATWEGGYKKKGQASSGIIALMDMLIKDCEMQLQSGAEDEATAQSDYEKLMSGAKGAVAQDTSSKQQAEASHAQANSDHQAADNARNGKNSELAAKNEEIAQLHGACDFLIANFDFRKTARTNEIEALKNAKAVLSGANYS
jgi:predicted  nucleic acid-binding Zn-ribbon protein